MQYNRTYLFIKNIESKNVYGKRSVNSKRKYLKRGWKLHKQRNRFPSLPKLVSFRQETETYISACVTLFPFAVDGTVNRNLLKRSQGGLYFNSGDRMNDWKNKLIRQVALSEIFVNGGPIQEPPKPIRHHCSMVLRGSMRTLDWAPICREARVTRAVEFNFSSPA